MLVSIIVCAIIVIDAITKYMDSAKRFVAQLAGVMQPQTVLVNG